MTRRAAQGGSALADAPQQIPLSPEFGSVKLGIPLISTAGDERTRTETNEPRPVGPANSGALVPGPTELSMSHDSPGIRRQVEILNSLGLHMRPADRFVKLALRFQSEIRVTHNGNVFNGKSILDLTSVGAECGTLLDLEA